MSERERERERGKENERKEQTNREIKEKGKNPAKTIVLFIKRAA